MRVPGFGLPTEAYGPMASLGVNGLSVVGFKGFGVQGVGFEGFVVLGV